MLRGLFGVTVVLLIVAHLGFVLIRSVPGNPFEDAKALDPAIVANLQERWALDGSLFEQYQAYMGGLLTEGDLGPSFKMRDVSVNEILAQSLPVSATLGLLGLFVALGIGLCAGGLAALRPGSWWDTSVMGAATLGLALPNFVLAGLLVLLFVFHWQLFPVAGLDGPLSLVLPALALGLPYAAANARLFRTGLLEVLGEDWIRTARAKGLSPGAVLVGHAARPALLPVVHGLGPALAAILSGSLVVEQVFALPGLGAHFVEAGLNADYNLALGVLLVYTLMLGLANMSVDFVASWLDPRIRL
ncbi:MAG: ABC transporter [Planctomycetota bacterium]|nr:MAG: ABC transporter [Planctomycetota bacterium]